MVLRVFTNEIFSRLTLCTLLSGVLEADALEEPVLKQLQSLVSRLETQVCTNPLANNQAVLNTKSADVNAYNARKYCKFFSELKAENLMNGLLMVENNLEKFIENHNRFILSEDSSSLKTNTDLFEKAANFDPTRSRQMESKFIYCKTYPRHFLTFKNLADDQKKLFKLSAAHENNRLLALSYLYHSRSNPTKMSSLWRGSLAKPSLVGSWSSTLTEQVSRISKVGFGSLPRLAYLVDCRPKSSLLGSLLGGRGGLIKKKFDIQEPHYAELESGPVLQELFDSTVMGFREEVRNLERMTSWFCELSSVLKTAQLVTEKLSQGVSVLVTCQSGIERTPQILSLAKTFLDPHFRTLEGFFSLLAADWVSFGYPFRSRLTGEEASPFFLEFLDCLHQIIRQRPQEFEFTNKLLVVLAESYLDNVFGEFLFDSQLEYMKYLEEEGQSSEEQDPPKDGLLWLFGAIQKFCRESDRRTVFINNAYKPSTNPLAVDTSFASMKLWAEVYNK